MPIARSPVSYNTFSVSWITDRHSWALRIFGKPLEHADAAWFQIQPALQNPSFIVCSDIPRCPENPVLKAAMIVSVTSCSLGSARKVCTLPNNPTPCPSLHHDRLHRVKQLLGNVIVHVIAYHNPAHKIRCGGSPVATATLGTELHTLRRPVFIVLRLTVIKGAR